MWRWSSSRSGGCPFETMKGQEAFHPISGGDGASRPRRGWQFRPVWPILASSCSQTSMRPGWGSAASGWAVAVSAIRPRHFFEVGLGAGIGLRVHRPRLLPGKIEVLQQIQHAVLAVAHLVALLDDAAEILGCPRTHAILLHIRPAQHYRTKARHLPLGQARRATGVRPIVQAFDASRVEPMNPIAEALPIHPSLPRCILATGSLQCRRPKWASGRASAATHGRRSRAWHGAAARQR